MSGARAPISGAEVLAFVEAWPPDDRWIHEESDVPGALFELASADPAASYTYEQLGMLIRVGGPKSREHCVAAGEWIRNWLDNRAYVTIVVTVPRERADALRETLREFGATCFEAGASHTTRHDWVAVDRANLAQARVDLAQARADLEAAQASAAIRQTTIDEAHLVLDEADIDRESTDGHVMPLWDRVGDLVEERDNALARAGWPRWMEAWDGSFGLVPADGGPYLAIVTPEDGMWRPWLGLGCRDQRFPGGFDEAEAYLVECGHIRPGCTIRPARVPR